MKNEAHFQTDEQGRLCFAHVHDSYLYGFSYMENEGIQLFLRRENVEKTTIKFHSVSEIHFESMSGVQIVADIFVWKVTDVPAWNIENGGWSTLFDMYLPADVGHYVEKVIKRQPDDFLVYITCSYGGSIAFVCSNLLITPS